MLFKCEKVIWYDMLFKYGKVIYVFQIWQVICTCSVFHVNSSCDAVWKESVKGVKVWGHESMRVWGMNYDDIERRLWFYTKDMIPL